MPSAKGFIYVESKTVVVNNTLLKDWILTCVYEPIGWKKPDLSVDVIYEGAAPRIGELVPITVVVKNIGDDATRDGTIMELYVDGKLLAEEEIPSRLKVGDEVRFNYKLIFDEAGEHRIKAVVDSIDWIIEKNEENNVDELTLTVVGPPDLTVEWINIPSTAFAWEPTTISFKVKNIGEDVAHNFTVRFECMGEVVCSPPVKTWGPLTLAPGKEKTFKLQVTFPSDGLYTVRIIANVEDNVRELDEENNFAEFMIQVFPPPPPPDLAIQQAGYDVTIKYVGEVATSHIKGQYDYREPRRRR